MQATSCSSDGPALQSGRGDAHDHSAAAVGPDGVQLAPVGGVAGRHRARQGPGSYRNRPPRPHPHESRRRRPARQSSVRDRLPPPNLDVRRACPDGMSDLDGGRGAGGRRGLGVTRTVCTRSATGRVFPGRRRFVSRSCRPATRPPRSRKSWPSTSMRVRGRSGCATPREPCNSWRALRAGCSQRPRSARRFRGASSCAELGSTAGLRSLARRGGQVLPVESVGSKRSEIIVAGDPLASVFDGHSGVLGIGNLFASGAGFPTEHGRKRPMAGTGQKPATARRVAETVNRVQRQSQRGRRVAKPWVSHDANKGDRHQPRQTKGRTRIHQAFDPVPIKTMMELVLAVGVHEDVDVRHFHRPWSRSSAS